MKRSQMKTFKTQLLWPVLKDSFLKLNPIEQFRNPAIFVTYVGAILISGIVLFELYHHIFNSFEIQLALWLWFTVLFANFASAFAEGRGKAQAEALRKVQTDNLARKLVNGHIERIPANEVKVGDLIVCEVEDIIPADGEVVDGIATVDESAITGESAPVIRESGGDRSAVTAGTRVVSDQIVIKVTSGKGSRFLDRMVSLIEGAKRQKTPNEIALNIVLSASSLIFLLTVLTLKVYADYSAAFARQDLSQIITVPALTALLVCLIPTTISALLNAIGIAGMDRLIQKNIIAKSGRAVEAAGDIDLLILDKTGTITLGNRMATEFIPSPGVDAKFLAETAQLASLADETPEGRSVVALAKNLFNLRAEALDTKKMRIIPFSAKSKMSGIDLLDEQHKTIRSIRKGAVDTIHALAQKNGYSLPTEIDKAVTGLARQGGTPLLVCDNGKIIGAIYLKDVVKGGIKERFAELRKMGIRTLMVTGDNPLTAGAIAAEAGVDDFVPHATPEKKLARIREEQEKGHMIAMAGDGTNDAPALAQADVGLAMNTGTQASREAGNMVDLDSNPTKLIDVVRIGKQLLITRGAITTFSIANDISKYFAIVPALFGSLYSPKNSEGPLAVLNLMQLESPHSAILSAVIFNALIIMFQSVVSG